MAIIFDKDKYPNLATYAHEMMPLNFKLEAREHEIERIQATFNRAIVSNIFLLGDAGVGKTTLLRAMIEEDRSRLYLELNVTAMTTVDDNGNVNSTVARRMQDLLDEVQAYGNEMRSSSAGKQDIVLFIDEFHLLPKLSEASVEAIKPALADSVRRHIRVVAATTFDEYEKYRINDNQPLIERFVFVRMKAPSDEQMLEILRTNAKNYLRPSDWSDALLRQIIENTNRYQPASSQPRKGIMMLDAMIGAHRYSGRPLDVSLLADCLYDTVGVQIAANINPVEVRDYLNKRVFSQEPAVETVYKQLNNIVADVYDKSRPMSAFLFAGPSGVGKTELVKALAYSMFGTESAMVRLDMSEYSEKHHADGMRLDLTSGVSRTPYCVVLLDEIEKAAPECSRLLLSVLDDGRLSDMNGREVSFKNTIIIATTNAGTGVFKEIAPYLESGSATGLKRAIEAYRPKIQDALESNKSFPNELIYRFDAFVPFNSLSDNTKRLIVKRAITKVCRSFRELHDLQISVGQEMVDWLVIHKNKGASSTDAKSGGARGMMHILDDQFKSAVSEAWNLKQYEIDENGQKRLYVAVDPDIEHDKLEDKRDIASFVRGNKDDYTGIYVGKQAIAKAYSAKNMRALDGYRKREATYARTGKLA